MSAVCLLDGIRTCFGVVNVTHMGLYSPQSDGDSKEAAAGDESKEAKEETDEQRLAAKVGQGG